MNSSEYSLEELVWIAKWINEFLKQKLKANRQELIKEFKRIFNKQLTPGKLARLYAGHGGNQQKFVRKYKDIDPFKPEQQASSPKKTKRKKQEKKAPEAAPVASSPAPVEPEPRLPLAPELPPAVPVDPEPEVPEPLPEPPVPEVEEEIPDLAPDLEVVMELPKREPKPRLAPARAVAPQKVVISVAEFNSIAVNAILRWVKKPELREQSAYRYAASEISRKTGDFVRFDAVTRRVTLHGGLKDFLIRVGELSAEKAADIVEKVESA